MRATRACSTAAGGGGGVRGATWSRPSHPGTSAPHGCTSFRKRKGHCLGVPPPRTARTLAPVFLGSRGRGARARACAHATHRHGWGRCGGFGRNCTGISPIICDFPNDTWTFQSSRGGGASSHAAPHRHRIGAPLLRPRLLRRPCRRRARNAALGHTAHRPLRGRCAGRAPRWRLEAPICTRTRRNARLTPHTHPAPPASARALRAPCA